ncbi:MAG: hypothetical protein GWO04_36915, partial [Actinobacteria bacterium]|nr:hypothetical protein [Actinomycetota bacterium]
MTEARPLGGASLVAFYGDKPAELDAWITELNGRLTALCGEDFTPYRPAQ